jgi:ABC-type sulfate transport system permease subunit
MVSVRFGFLGQKPVQTGLARFFSFGSVFSGLVWFFLFGFGSIFSVLSL